MLRGVSLIVSKSLRQHAVSTVVTALSTALATGLVTAVTLLSVQSRDAFSGGRSGFDGVLGARGSEVQLVLNTVFHLETSPGNLDWERYEELASRPGVVAAVPYAVGDSYRGFRVVGTTPEAFERLGADGAPLALTPGSRAFDPALAEAVVGAEVARATGLRPGDHFHPTHGVVDEGGHEHEDEYYVVGVLEPTGTPTDRVVWIPIEGLYRMDGHVLRGADLEFEATAGEAIPDEHKEVSAVLVAFANPRVGQSIAREVAQWDDATLAFPIGRVMLEIFDKLGWMARVLEAVAWLVVVVAAASILASLYNAMHERRREFAILRALGARRATVLAAIVAEAGAIAAAGAALGLLVHLAILAAAATVVRERTGVALDPFAWHPVLVWAPLGIAAVGALAGLAPALAAYRTEVAENLVPTS